MIQIKEDEPLAPYTTFKIGGPAKYFCAVKDVDDLKEALAFAKGKGLPVFVLGGGSNVLISDKGFDGLVIKMELCGARILLEDDKEVILKVAAGEKWDGIVEMAVKNGWWGIENLSHIPGSCGAVVVQNVGAYGQEVRQTVKEVEVFDILDNTVKIMSNEDCGFGYRRSVFNGIEKGRYVILSVRFRFIKDGKPNLDYRDLKERFNGRNPSLRGIRQAVTEIRDKKYPFPQEAKNGNAGSFFKNVVLDAETYGCVEDLVKKNFGEGILSELRQRVFKEAESIKIPAAFLLDICGLKDVQVGGAKINRNQPLVIINATGKATSKDVLDLIKKVRQTVCEKTGLKLAHEPELVGFSPGEIKEVEN